MIKIINYGLGNIRAFLNIYKSLSIDCEVCSSKESLSDSKKLILPGVGSFDWAMQKLNASGMRDKLDELVLSRNIPVLGVCVGMQIMAKSSEEGSEEGLNWIEGGNFHLSSIVKQNIKLPHMGWNDIDIKDSILFKNIENPKFYFLHSYFINPENIKNIDAYVNYGAKFPCTISKNNIFGVQFHPEKSHNYGINILKNFANIKS